MIESQDFTTAWNVLLCDAFCFHIVYFVREAAQQRKVSRLLGYFPWHLPCLKRLNFKLFGVSSRYSVSERPHVYRENPPYGYGFLICSQQNNNNRIEQTKTTQDFVLVARAIWNLKFFSLKFLIFLDQLAHRSWLLSMRGFKVTIISELWQFQ